MYKIYFISGYLFLILLFSSCSLNSNPDSQSELEKISQEIDFIIGNASCENDLQCGSIPLGQKACGGPSGFRIYSSLNTNTVKLLELSKKHVELSTKLVSGSGLMSNCMLEQPPIVVCKKVCVKKP